MTPRLFACSFSMVVVACGSSESSPGSENVSGDARAGAEFGDPPEADRGPDACIDLDQCPTAETPVPSDDPATPIAVVEAVGTKLIVTTYAWLRKQPDADAAAFENVAPLSGVDNDSHPGQPTGMVPPGQRVTLEKRQPTNGFYQVRYDDRVGWIAASKLLAIDPDEHPVDFALRPAARDAFFKRQVNYFKYSKDGPATSANCGPTSLAMARLIFRAEPQGLSVEQSIHQARKSCCGGNDADGTTAAEVAHSGELGLQHLPQTQAQKNVFWNSNRTGWQVMDHVDEQLDKKRVYALIGVPDAGYRGTMNDLHQAEDVPYTYTYGKDHDPPGHPERHWILIVGRLDNGKYVVGDPLSRIGMVAMPRSILVGYVAASDVRAGNSYWAAP